MPEPGDYDRFVDWRKRLARESPFYRSEFEAHGVRGVLDVGCGTGMLPILWATWGLHVVGVDPDAGMLAKATRNAEDARVAIEAAGGSVRFMEAGFGELAGLGLGPVDAVTCTGNALPHIDGQAALAPTLRDFATVLRPGGLLVLHLLNHDRLIGARVRSIPPVVREDEEGTWAFLRFIDYEESAIRFDFVTLHRPAGAWESGAAWETESRRSSHTALPSRLLRGELVAAGFLDVRVFGDHEGSTFRPSEDESVLMVALRREGGFGFTPSG
jgi:glycine/sarcosine N-methyltransferase